MNLGVELHLQVCLLLIREWEELIIVCVYLSHHLFIVLSQ